MPRFTGHFLCFCMSEGGEIKFSPPSLYSIILSLKQRNPFNKINYLSLKTNSTLRFS